MKTKTGGPHPLLLTALAAAVLAKPFPSKCAGTTSRNWAGEVPAGYFSFESESNNVFLFFRTVMPQGEDGPDRNPALRSPSKPAFTRCGRKRSTSRRWSSV